MTLDSAKRAFNKLEDQKNPLLLTIPHGDPVRNSDEWQELYYAFPNTSEGSIKSLNKKFDKFIAKYPNLSINQDLASIISDLTELSKTVRELKDADKVRKANKKAAQHVTRVKKETATMTAEFTSLNEPLAGHRAAYMNRIVEAYRRQLEQMIERVKAAGMDLSQVAPYPKSTMSRREYKVAQSAYNYYRRYFTPVDGTRRWNGPEIVVLNNDAVERTIEHATREANTCFDGYVLKLLSKIGKNVKTATLVGPLWEGSMLTVECQDGEKQVWTTKVIINCSCLGTLFNQWPTRRSS